MKYKLLSLAVLSAFSGIAAAATNVTLYGVAETAYRNQTGDGYSLRQGASGESRLGVKGQEDLGNGTAAFFQLESRYDLDTGANTGTAAGSGFFDERALVGLSFANGVHKVYFGRAASPIDRLGNNIGHLATDFGVKSSMGGWRNGAYYDYNANGLAVAAAVTTKGGAYAPPVVTSTEGAKGEKSAYGLSARYDAANWYFGAGWQADNDKYGNAATTTLSGDSIKIKNEWLAVAGYKFNPVFVGASYADAKGYDFKHRRIIQAHLGGNLTPNDLLFVNYARYKTTTTGDTLEKYTRYGLGYVHSLSKRTSVFAGVARNKDHIADESYTDWDVGLKHTF